MTCLQVLGADMAKMFPGKSAEEVMAMFDKDGTGQLDLAEVQEMKESFKSRGPAPVRQEATLTSPAAKRKGLKAAEEAAGNCIVWPTASRSTWCRLSASAKSCCVRRACDNSFARLRCSGGCVRLPVWLCQRSRRGRSE